MCIDGWLGRGQLTPLFHSGVVVSLDMYSVTVQQPQLHHSHASIPSNSSGDFPHQKCYAALYQPATRTPLGNHIAHTQQAAGCSDITTDRLRTSHDETKYRGWDLQWPLHMTLRMHHKAFDSPFITAHCLCPQAQGTPDVGEGVATHTHILPAKELKAPLGKRCL